MNINLNIERLVLDGLPVTSDHSDSVQTAVETELRRLLAQQGLNHLSAGAVPHLSANSIQVTRDTKPVQLGHQLAGALIKSIGNNKLNNKG
jgi:hypothetical protein